MDNSLADCTLVSSQEPKVHILASHKQTHFECSSKPHTFSAARTQSEHLQDSICCWCSNLWKEEVWLEWPSNGWIRDQWQWKRREFKKIEKSIPLHLDRQWTQEKSLVEMMTRDGSRFHEQLLIKGYDLIIGKRLSPECETIFHGRCSRSRCFRRLERSEMDSKKPKTFELSFRRKYDGKRIKRMIWKSKIKKFLNP